MSLMLSPMSPNPDLTSVLPLPGMTLSHRQREGTAVGRAARGGESWRGAVKVGCDCGTVAQGRCGRLEEARGMRVTTFVTWQGGHMSAHTQLHERGTQEGLPHAFFPLPTPSPRPSQTLSKPWAAFRFHGFFRLNQ